MPELYMRDYSIWFFNVCMDKREDFLRPLRVLCSSRVNVQSQTLRYTDAIASGNLCL